MPFRVVAHRGNSVAYPENTIEAFRSALACEADGIEFDVRVTRDNVGVIFHDSKLKRIAGVEGEIQNFTLEEVRKFDAGAWKDPKFKGLRIPTLDETLDLCLKKIPLEIELKAAGAAEVVVKALQERGRPYDSVLVTSFETGFLRAAHGLDSNLPIGFLISRTAPQPPSEAQALGCSSYLPHGQNLTQQISQDCHEKKMTVRAWGIPNLTAAQAAIAAGADGCTYDDPRELIEYLKKR